MGIRDESDEKLYQKKTTRFSKSAIEVSMKWINSALRENGMPKVGPEYEHIQFAMLVFQTVIVNCMQWYVISVSRVKALCVTSECI